MSSVNIHPAKTDKSRQVSPHTLLIPKCAPCAGLPSKCRQPRTFAQIIVEVRITPSVQSTDWLSEDVEALIS